MASVELDITGAALVAQSSILLNGTLGTCLTLANSKVIWASFGRKRNKLTARQAQIVTKDDDGRRTTQEHRKQVDF